MVKLAKKEIDFSSYLQIYIKKPDVQAKKFKHTASQKCDGPSSSLVIHFNLSTHKYSR